MNSDGYLNRARILSRVTNHRLEFYIKDAQIKNSLRIFVISVTWDLDCRLTRTNVEKVESFAAERSNRKIYRTSLDSKYSFISNRYV